ncbi:MAG: CoA transferase [Chloroflexi bacterium]|nr:CoA transferase [Chloroflexota bacterium]
MTSDTANLGPLVGLRVLELADEKGHYCGKLLADMGADVIKIEPPAGDAARRVGPFVHDAPHPDRSLFFWHYNTSKRGVTLNLETPEGRDLFRRLARGADMVLETLAPGYLPGLRLGYRELSAENPGLIMTSLTPFGQTGPYRDFVTSDLVSLAMGGPMASCGYDDIAGAPPIRGEGHQAYQTGSHYAFVGALVALYWRDLTGQGQYIDASIHEACSCTTEGAFPSWVYSGRVVIRQTGRHASMDPSQPWQFLCKDGRYVNLIGGVPRDQRQWQALLRWMDSKGMAEDLMDEKYQEVFRRRTLGRQDPLSHHVNEVLTRFFGNLPAEEVYHGAQACFMPMGIVRSPEETLDDPHFAEDRAFFSQLEHEELGRAVTYPGRPYIFQKTPWQLRRRAPRLGEHNEEVYCGELGLSKERLTLLAECGVI